MRHGVKKIRFNWGKDANKMLLKKLAVNFFTHGRLETTLSKAKILRPQIEKMVMKMKVYNEANKNYLLKNLGDEETIDFGFKTVGPALKSVKSGYVRIIKKGIRSSDGSMVARIEWAYPVVKEVVKKTDVKVKAPASVRTVAGKEA